MSETTICDDWIEGSLTRVSSDLIQPIFTARKELEGFTHKEAVALWDQFYAAAIQWKEDFGEVPFVFGNKPSLKELHPWEARGGLGMRSDPVDLVKEKLGSYDPYIQLEEKVGRNKLLAAIILWSSCSFEGRRADVIGWKGLHEIVINKFSEAVSVMHQQARGASENVAVKVLSMAAESHREKRAELGRRAAAASSQKRRERSADIEREIKQGAEELLRTKPWATNREIAKDLADEFSLAASTIEKRIRDLLGALRQEWRKRSY